MSRNLRRKPRISYYEIEEPDLDEYIFCDKCGDYVFEYCSIHGPLLVVPDDEVPTPTGFPSFVPRAALTIPQEFLHIAPSNIPGAGLGVFATLTLPKGVQFGPYCGVRTKQADPESDYCWQLYDGSNRRPVCVVDARDAERSNWMRYVNCSRHWLEQNLVAFQYQGELYYRTIKIIPRFTELLVFYGAEFANSLQINLKLYNSSQGLAHLCGPPQPKKTKLKNETIEKQKTAKALPINDKKNTAVKKKKALVIKKPAPVIKPPDPVDVSNDIIQEDADITTKSQKVDTNNSTNFDKNTNEIPSDPSKSQKINNLPLKRAKEYSCDICEYTTNCEKYLNSHLKVHASNKQFSCDVCPFLTVSKISLIRHLRTHTGEKPYSCDVCNKSFNRKSDLNVHRRIHTGEKPYSCDVCNQSFNQKNNLVLHRRIHTGEKPYSCDVCNQSFNQKNNLVRHRRIHTGEKPYSCDVCNQSFNQKSNLVLHRRIHTGEKPYSCDVCNQSFNHKSHLVEHRRIHTGEKPYPCDVCNQSFNRKGTLVLHRRIHTGEKPYSCDVCNKSFNQRSDLNIHRRIHTGEKPYSCDVCNKRFISKSYLSHHRSVHTRKI